MAHLCRIPITISHSQPLCEIGARVCFEGLVRGVTAGVETHAIEYDAHEPMALKLLEALEVEARDRFRTHRVDITHRLGIVPVGEASVVVVVESAHRADAFAACSWVMDEIKKRIPIWKKEIGPTGETWHHPLQGQLKASPPLGESP